MSVTSREEDIRYQNDKSPRSNEELVLFWRDKQISELIDEVRIVRTRLRMSKVENHRKHDELKRWRKGEYARNDGDFVLTLFGHGIAINLW